MNACGPHHCIGDCRRAEAALEEQRRMIQQLRYERDHWKREAGVLADADCADSLAAQFDLTDVEAMICAALYRRREKLLPANTLENLLDEERGHSVESNVVAVIISRIRDKLGETAIETFRSRGYRLSRDTLSLFDRRLKVGTP